MLGSYGPQLPPSAGGSASAYGETPSELPCQEGPVMRGHEGAVLAVRFNPLGTYAMSCGKDKTLRLWNPHRGALVKTYTGHGYEVRDVVISKDNSKFASCGGDKQLFYWDVASGRFIRKFKGHDATINAVVYGGPSEDVLVTAGYDQSVKIWDCRSRSIDAVQTMRTFRDSVTGVAVHGAAIHACSVDGTLRRFDVRIGRAYTDDLHHAITGLAVSGDGACVLAACLDSRLRLIDKDSGALLATYSGHIHTTVKMDCCLTPSAAHVVCGSEDGSVFFWDLLDSNIVASFAAHGAVVCGMSLHPQGTCLLTCSVDGTVKAWTTAAAAEAAAAAAGAGDVED